MAFTIQRKILFTAIGLYLFITTVEDELRTFVRCVDDVLFHELGDLVIEHD